MVISEGVGVPPGRRKAPEFSDPGYACSAIAHYEYIASAKMTPVLREAILCHVCLNHVGLLLQHIVKSCPAEFADIFMLKTHVRAIYQSSKY